MAGDGAWVVPDDDEHPRELLHVNAAGVERTGALVEREGEELVRSEQGMGGTLRDDPAVLYEDATQPWNAPRHDNGEVVDGRVAVGSATSVVTCTVPDGTCNRVPDAIGTTTPNDPERRWRRHPVARGEPRLTS